MKKLVMFLVIALVLVGCSTGSAVEGFDKSKAVTVVSREDGSGTRGAFVELAGIEEKDADGNKVDHTSPEAIIANKTDVVLSNIAGDTYAVGYLSLGSLNSSLKGLSVDGVEPTVENIVADKYTIARPFNIVLGDNVDELTQDFIDFILSKEGQAVVVDAGYIALDAPNSYTATNMSGKITVAGSSSVSPVMEKLSEAYRALNADVEIEMQTNDSTAGVQAAIDGTVNLGMASRALKDAEAAVVEGIVIAIDGIVVVVNNDNPLDNVTLSQVNDIFRGNVATWDELIGE